MKGRLDADTSGLLLFSRSGVLTNTLLDPSSRIEREYEAIVANAVNFETLRQRLASGVETSEGAICADLISSEILESNVRC